VGGASVDPAGPDYRRHFLAADTGQAVVGVAVVCVTTLVFLFVDHIFVTDPRDLVPLVTLRTGFTVGSLALIPSLLQMRSPLRYDVAVTLWELACVALVVYTDATRPATFIHNATLHVLVVLGAYVVVPNRLALQAAVALLLTGVDTYRYFFVKQGLSAQALVVTLGALALANLIGALTSARLGAYRRRQYDAQVAAERLHGQLEILAATDALTGLLNRRRFVELAEQAFGRYQRYDRPFALLIADLDHFKAVNDRFGHHAGDDVLRAFAGALVRLMRSHDAVGRIGGEEFAMLLPETGASGAQRVAERIAAACRQIAVPAPGRPGRVSVSLGAATVQPADASVDDVLRRADTALYEAKRAGRDRVAVA